MAARQSLRDRSLAAGRPPVAGHGSSTAGFAPAPSWPAAPLRPDELLDIDKEFYASRRHADATPVIGPDAAGRAVRYALAVGLLDDAYAGNLERHSPGPQLRRAVAGAGPITVTGGIGYITHRTYEALLECPGPGPGDRVRTAHGPVPTGDRQPCPLRSGHPDGVLADLPAAAVHRPGRTARAIEQTLRAGYDPTRLETEGRYHTQLYQSRPRHRHERAVPWAQIGRRSGPIARIRPWESGLSRRLRPSSSSKPMRAPW